MKGIIEKFIGDFLVDFHYAGCCMAGIITDECYTDRGKEDICFAFRTMERGVMHSYYFKPENVFVVYCGQKFIKIGVPEGTLLDASQISVFSGGKAKNYKEKLEELLARPRL